jgi:hypothetical protein
MKEIAELRIPLPRKCLEIFVESDGTVKKTYSTRPLFIGRGGSFKKTPR